MSHSVPQQHPAVVLRSHYMHMRALLVFACIAVVGLTIAAPAAVTAPAARYDGGPDEGTSGPNALPVNTRCDGGPEEGTSGATR